MLRIEENQKINVEQLKSVLLRRKTIREPFKLPFTQEQTADALEAAIRAEVEYRRGKFALTPNLKKHISVASSWLTAPSHFGLLLCGVPGNGKTTMMRAIVSLIGYVEPENAYKERMAIRMVNAKEIVRTNRDEYKSYIALCNAPLLAIDDLGTEPSEVLSYGNILNPVTDLLSRRYDDQLTTIVTTNLTPKQIREVYKDRIADRFNEMMQIIIFEDKTHRK